tara:strand:+ start:2677 stop:3129 length:453 start_codon:yes stop_codon:yes gene_type:complete
MFAETLAGIALVKSAVDGIKGAIGTAKDVGEIAGFIDQMFQGEQEIQKRKQKKASDPFSVNAVATETINAKLAKEKMDEMRTLIDLRFGHGTWAGIVAERARRIQEAREAEKLAQRQKEAQQEEMMVAAAICLGLLLTVGIFVFLYFYYM